MPTTYEPIATQTLGGSSSASFTSIASSWTDLRLVIVQQTTSNVSDRITFNSDTGTNYSFTQIYGDGSTAASTRGTSAANISSGINAASPNFALLVMDIFSYAGSTFKTCLLSCSNDANGSGTVRNRVALWRNTSAINRLDFSLSSGTYATGSTATLYGIKNA